MDILTQKKCSACGEWKDRSEFHKNKLWKDGLEYRCKSCRRLDGKKYRDAHREKRRATCKAWDTKNAGRRLKVARKWRSENKDKIQAWKDRYHEKHADREQEHCRNWRNKNRAHIAEYSRDYQRNNSEKIAAWRHGRRARINGVGGVITAQEWADLKAKYNHTCLWCKRREPEIKLTIDHVIPIVMGGTNTIDNVQPLCKSCNCRKNKKHMDFRSADA